MKTIVTKKIETYPYDFILKDLENGFKMATIEYPGEWGASSGYHEDYDVALADAVIACKDMVDDLVELIYPLYAHDIVSDRMKFQDALQVFSKLAK